MCLFKFITEDGEEAFISAKNKKDAVIEYCKEYGETKDWVKNNCRVINLGEED